MQQSGAARVLAGWRSPWLPVGLAAAGAVTLAVGAPVVIGTTLLVVAGLRWAWQRVRGRTSIERSNAIRLAVIVTLVAVDLEIWAYLLGRPDGSGFIALPAGNVWTTVQAHMRHGHLFVAFLYLHAVIFLFLAFALIQSLTGYRPHSQQSVWQDWDPGNRRR